MGQGTRERPPHRRRRLRFLRRVLLGLALLPFVLAGAGAVYNTLWIRHYRSLFPPPGKLYSINGKAMHLYCTGDGSPTIVLEAGLGSDAMAWTLVQPTLSKTTRVCSYDRIGVGWSDPQDGPSDSEGAAERLHALLSEAGIAGPVVLMGHSIGGLHIRVFATRFPTDVAGMVFVDATTPDLALHPPAELLALRDQEDEELRIARWKVALGITRLEDECPQAPSDDVRAGWLKATGCVPAGLDAVRQEALAFQRSAEEAASTGPYRDLPILILSQDTNRSAPEGAGPPPGWSEAQEGLKRLSTRSRRIIARHSGHSIQFARADVVNREVPRFIEEIRTGTPSPETGTTVTE
jgi:pimeloyl-ACP methyl ester carboxylesterase